MTPKEKVIELINSFERLIPNNPDYPDYVDMSENEIARQCALIAVDEIQDALREYDNRNDTCELQNMDRDFNYWNEVEEELKNI